MRSIEPDALTRKVLYRLYAIRRGNYNAISDGGQTILQKLLGGIAGGPRDANILSGTNKHRPLPSIKRDFPISHKNGIVADNVVQMSPQTKLGLLQASISGWSCRSSPGWGRSSKSCRSKHQPLCPFCNCDAVRGPLFKNQSATSLGDVFLALIVSRISLTFAASIVFLNGILKVWQATRVAISEEIVSAISFGM